MKKILILGGSHRDIPLIKAAKELGFYVITLGDREYYIGHSYADKYYKVNFNDLDAVKKIVIDEHIDFIIPGSGEESYLNTVELSELLHKGNFDTFKIAKLVHNKWKFKEFCLEKGVVTPYGVYYHDTLDISSLPYPLVVKPTNLSGGRGVEIVQDEIALNKALLEGQKVSNEIFLEAFVEGKLYAYSVFLKKQKVYYGFLGKDDTYLNPYLISTAYPTSIKKDILDRLKNDIEQIAQSLSLVDGMFHLQVIVKEDLAYIIDVTRRIPGDLYPYLIEACDGVDYAKAVVKSYIGEEITDEFTVDKTQEFIIRHCVMANKNGILGDIFIDESIKNNIIYRLDLVTKGTEIKDYLSSQLAIIFIKPSQNQKEIVSNINKLIYPKVMNDRKGV